MKMSMEVTQKNEKENYYIIQKSHFWVYSQRNWKQGLKEHHVHSSTIHNLQEVEATQMFTYEWTGKQKWYTHTMYIPWWLSWSRIHLRCRRPQFDSWVTKIPGEMVGYPLQYFGASLVAQMVKNPPAVQESWVRSLGWEDSLEEGMSTHSSILPWRIPIGRGAWWATVHTVSKS